MILGNKMKLYENSTFENIWKNVVSVVKKVVSCGKINTPGRWWSVSPSITSSFAFIRQWVGWVGGFKYGVTAAAGGAFIR